MKENNKTKLKIQQVLYTSLVTMLLITFVVIGNMKNTTTKIANDNENNLQTNQDDMKSKTITRSASTKVTSRSSNIRESISEHKENIVEEKYITIDQVTISKNMDLTKRTGLSKEDFKILVKNIKQDRTKFFYNNSDTIYDLCKKYQLNEIFFCGLIAGESGWNIAGNHRRTYNYISLMSGGKLLKFSSVEEGLEKAASTLHTKYLTPSGKFYSGKTLSGVKKRFCPASPTWVDLIYKCMSQMV